MGSLFRSEEMTLCQLFLQSEAAYACVSELGELGLVQFRDLNPDVNAFQRKFVNEVRRCDEMERKLRFLEKEIKKDGIPMLDTGDNPDAPAPREMIDLEATFEKLENEMKEVNANSEALKRNYLELTELKHILRKTQTFFDEAELQQQAMHDPLLAEERVGLLGEEVRPSGQALRLGFVAGVILRERIPAFERMLWRVCRGNVFLRQAEIETPLEDPVTGDHVNKSVFIIFFQGDQLKSRVKKICEGFRATLYPCPETPAERREMAIGVMTRIEDLNTVLGQTQDHRHRVLVAAAKNIKVWFIKVRKIKAIYHTLNMLNLDVTQKCLIAECWCPVSELDRIQQGLRRGTERSGSSMPSILNRMETRQDPPTYHRTNKFTSVFQSIIDAYGVASYREVNPAPFSIITFPFLFSIMFGDFGHGAIMFLFGLGLILFEKKIISMKITDEIVSIFFGGRYLIMMMGLFSIYSGLLYNDIFAKSVNIFGSHWLVPKAAYGNVTIFAKKSYQLNPNGSAAIQEFTGTPYPFGLDPVWQLSSNKVMFQNSMKMKYSVIFGIAHMLCGVILSVCNHKYFKRPLNIFCEFIPQVLFMMSIFGYLVILIFYKWVTFSAASTDEFKSPGCAPSLLIGLINMFLFKYSPHAGEDIEGDKSSFDPCSNRLVYPSQDKVQYMLVVLALLSVPWMLLIKPLILRSQAKSKQQRPSLMAINNSQTVDDVVHHDAITAHTPEPQHQNRQTFVNSGDIVQPNGEVTPQASQPAVYEEQEFNFGEEMIYQGIHVIEYCLSCISHTASYLRLWALSLAHAQLSEVLWTMVLRIGFTFGKTYLGAAMLTVVFTPWAFLTVVILCLMEGLSAFLHTLRLHWVELMSKFYKGDGYSFVPFSFAHLMDDHNE